MRVRKGLFAGFFFGAAMSGVGLQAQNVSIGGPINVSTFHNNYSRDGVYIDPAFTKNAAAGLTRDVSFDGRIVGNVYAQLVYLEGGPGGRALLIAATEANNVYALDAVTGSIVWQRNIGIPVPLSSLLCGDINPLGITGTPVIDIPSRTIFFDAMTTPDGGTTKHHLIYALNADTGTTNSGWPVNVDATAHYGTTVFTSSTQNQRGALAILGGILYVPFGGHFGDCGTYYGWIVGVALSDPSQVLSWATGSRGGGSWAVGGVASDGLNTFIATGNTFGATTWSGGEAILKFQPGPVFNGQTTDYWAPSNWATLDANDTDIGGSGALLIDVPGGTPSQLAISLGKDGNAYLLNRTNLGGIGAQLSQAHVSSTPIIQAATGYHTAQGTYVAFCGNTSESQISAFRISAANPPTATTVWSQNQNGRGSPFVTSTDGTNDVIVWGLGAEGDQRLHGFDGDTGTAVFGGGGANELMSGIRRFNTGIVARGRVYLAGDNRVYAFTVPAAPIVLSDPAKMPDGSFQFAFTNIAGMSFTAFSTPDVTLSATNWTRLGPMTEVSPGQYRFVDSQATNSSQQFYRVQSP